MVGVPLKEAYRKRNENMLKEKMRVVCVNARIERKGQMIRCGDP